MLPISTTSPKFENTFLNRRSFSEKELDSILKKYTLLNLKQVKQLWNLHGRWYHNFEHCQYMLFLAQQYKTQIESTDNFEALVLAILFHDIIYVPGSKDNEHVSANFFKACLKPNVDYFPDATIYVAIKRTAYLTSIGEPAEYSTGPNLTWWLQQLDLYPLIVADRKLMLINFVLVWEEFKHLSNGNKEEFETRQNQFLGKLAEQFNFEYEPITWVEINAELEKPINIDAYEAD